MSNFDPAIADTPLGKSEEVLDWFDALDHEAIRESDRKLNANLAMLGLLPSNTMSGELWTKNVLQGAAESGVLVDTEFKNLKDEDIEPAREKKHLSPMEANFPPSINRPKQFTAMFDELSSALSSFSSSGSFEPDDNLVQSFAKWMTSIYKPPPQSYILREINSSLKEAPIKTLDVVFGKLYGKKKVLSVGCGTGNADVQRFFLANGGKAHDLVVDLYDPYVTISESARYIGGTKISGRNYPKKEHIDFSSEKESYDVVMCFNSMHYLSKRLPDMTSILESVVQTVKPGGWIVGFFPSFDGFSSATRNFHNKNGPYFDAHIRLLGIETGDSGLEMVTRVFDKIFTEPIIEPGSMQVVLQKNGMYGTMMSGCSAKDIVGYKSKTKPEDNPEMDGFTTAMFYKPDRVSLPEVKEYPLLSVKLRPGGFRTDIVPEYLANRGAPLRGNNLWRFTSGGMWLFSEKTDGIGGLFRVKDRRLFLYPEGHDVIRYDIDVDILTDITGQVEFVREKDSHKWNVVLLQLMEFQGFIPGQGYLPKMTYCFGSGMMLAEELKNKGCPIFSMFKFKQWSFIPAHLGEVEEGYVIMDFRAPPIKKIPNMDIHSRVPGNAIYVKKVWTVDLRFGSHNETRVIDGIEYAVPDHLEIQFPCVLEFEIGGKFVRPRPEKKASNAPRTIYGLLQAVKFKKFTEKIFPMYARKWRPVYSFAKYLLTPFRQWTNEEIFALSISYPRGFLDIKDKAARETLYLIRSTIGENMSLNAAAQSITKNLDRQTWSVAEEDMDRMMKDGLKEGIPMPVPKVVAKKRSSKFSQIS